MSAFILILAVFTSCRAEQYFLPEFELLPNTVEYFNPTSSKPLNLSCRAWPSTANISFLTSYRSQTPSASPPEGTATTRMQPTPLHPIPTTWTVKGNADLIVSSVGQVQEMDQMAIHCLAKSRLGSVLSPRPVTVIRASISDFQDDLKMISFSFMRGNIAILNCLPPFSDPPAEVVFLRNKVPMINTDKYKYVYWPDKKRVSFLIQNFGEEDEGLYVCSARNPITGEKKESRTISKLLMLAPDPKYTPHIVFPMSGSTIYDSLNVTEGDTVTLFCLSSSSPPLTTSIHRFKPRPLSKHSRYSSNQTFGTFEIKQIQPEDEGTYSCSAEVGVESITNHVTLSVKRRLRIVQKPVDIPVSTLGKQSARFTCNSSDPMVKPHWYFNGRIQNSQESDNSIHIAEVARQHLGVYQCVVRRGHEWVTAQATLSDVADTIVKKHDKLVDSTDSPEMTKKDRSSNVKGNFAGQILSKRHKRTPMEEIASPDLVVKVHGPIFDNLAVKLVWQYLGNLTIKNYRVQTSQNKGGDQWRSINTIPDEWTKKEIYLTKSNLEAGFRYRFRIHAIEAKNDATIMSDWTSPVSFQHIVKGPPFIEKSKTLNTSAVNISWVYTTESLRPDGFHILYHNGTDPVIFPVPLYQQINVTDGNARNYVMTNLKAGTTYHVVLLAYSGHGKSRKISELSNEHKIKTLPGKVIYDNTTSAQMSNNLLYMILGGLAAGMIIVIIIFLLLCLCRRCCAKDKDVNEFGYKDPAKMIHREKMRQINKCSSFMLSNLTTSQQMHNLHTNGTLISNGSRMQGVPLPPEGAGLMADHYAQQQQNKYASQQFYPNGTVTRDWPSGGSFNDNRDMDEKHRHMESNSTLCQRGGAVTQAMLTPSHHYSASNTSSRLNLTSPPPGYSTTMHAMDPQYAMRGGPSQASLASNHHGGQMPTVTYLRPGDGANTGFAPLPMLHHSLVPQGVPGHMDTSGGSQMDTESVHSYRSQQGTNEMGGPQQGDKSHRRRRRRPVERVSESDGHCSQNSINRMTPQPYYPTNPSNEGGPRMNTDSPSTLTRRAPHSTSPPIFLDPPRVRDFSEYGIPQINGAGHPAYRPSPDALQQQGYPSNEANYQGYPPNQANYQGYPPNDVNGMPYQGYPPNDVMNYQCYPNEVAEVNGMDHNGFREAQA